MRSCRRRFLGAGSVGVSDICPQVSITLNSFSLRARPRQTLKPVPVPAPELVVELYRPQALNRNNTLSFLAQRLYVALVLCVCVCFVNCRSTSTQITEDAQAALESIHQHRTRLGHGVPTQSTGSRWLTAPRIASLSLIAIGVACFIGANK